MCRITAETICTMNMSASYTNIKISICAQKYACCYCLSCEVRREVAYVVGPQVCRNFLDASLTLAAVTVCSHAASRNTIEVMSADAVSTGRATPCWHNHLDETAVLLVTFPSECMKSKVTKLNYTPCNRMYKICHCHMLFTFLSVLSSNYNDLDSVLKLIIYNTVPKIPGRCERNSLHILN
jgi:hypothetical protein